MIPFTSGKVMVFASIARDTMSKVRRKARTFYAHSLHTVFVRLNAAAFIKFLAFPMRLLFKGGVYFEITFHINH